jgi:hypothetical protein
MGSHTGMLTSGKANPANQSICDEFGQKVSLEIEPPISLQLFDFCLEVYTEVYKS